MAGTSSTHLTASTMTVGSAAVAGDARDPEVNKGSRTAVGADGVRITGSSRNRGSSTAWETSLSSSEVRSRTR